MKSNRKFVIVSGMAVIGLSTAYASMLGTSYTWVAGNGNWNDPVKWNPNGVPDVPGEAATISAAGTYSVTMNISPDIDFFAMSNATATLNLGSNSLTTNLPNAFSNSGVIQTGGANAINVLTGQATIAATGVVSINQNNSLTWNGTLLQNNGLITINPQQIGNPATLTFNTSTVLSGSGLIQLSQNGAATLATAGASTLTQGANHKIQGRGIIQAALVNNGSVLANWGGQLLTMNTRNVQNQNLFSAASGGGLFIQGITVTQGPTAQIFADGGEIYLNGATIVGGILSRSGASSVRNQTGSTNRYTGTTITGLLNVEQNSTAELAGAQTINNGTISVNPEQIGNPTRIHLTQGHTLTGTGLVALNNSESTAEISGIVGATLTHAANHTIAGRGRISVPFANAGTINASWGSQNLSITSLLNTNTGLLTATSTGNLVFSGASLSQSGAGQILANGGNVTVSSSSITGGALNRSGSSAFFNGGVSTYSNLTNNAELRITQNTGANMSGTIINNGTININPEQIGNVTFINAPLALTLTGTGVLQMSNASTAADLRSAVGIPVTNSVGHTIAGRGQISGTLINAGTVNGNWGSQTLILNSQNKQNSNLITAASTGQIQLAGMTLTQTGAGRLFANGGNILHSENSKVIGGKLQSAGTSVHYISSGLARLEDVTNEGTFQVNQNNQLNVTGTALTNTGTINVNPEQIGNNTKMEFGNSIAINGSGSIQLSNSGTTAELGGANSGVLVTHGSGHNIRGRGRISVNMVNNGFISANWGAQNLEITSPQFTNNATMQAESTGNLVFNNVAATQGANGTIQPLSGDVYLTGTTTLSGGKFLLSPSGRFVFLQGGTPTIGNLTNEADIRVPQNNVGRINANIVNTKLIHVNPEQIGNITRLDVIENATISGAGLIQLAAPGQSAQVAVSTDKTLTVGVGQTIQGRGRISGQVINQGNIRANWGAQTLELIPTQSGISNEGLIRIEGNGSLNLSDGSKFLNKGDFIIDPSHTATVTAGDFKQTSGAVTINGTLDLAPGAKIDADGGIVKGGGVLDGNLQNDDADVQPGTSPGKLRVQGTYSQAAAGEMTMEIGGLTPVTQHDVLEVTGAVTVNGKLTIKLINGFTPTPGQTFTIVTGSSVAGTFNQVVLDGTSDAEPNVLYNANSITVTFLTKVNPTSVTTILGLPFGGDLNSLFSSDDDKYTTLCDENEPNGTVEITTTSPVATLSNLRFAFETGATRPDLTERIEMFNYSTNQWVTVGALISVSVPDRRRVVVQLTNPSQYVRAGDRQMKARVTWTPQADLETSDGWSIAIDQAAWFISE